MCKVLSPGLWIKTAVLLCCPYISNGHTLDDMIIKHLTSLSRYHNVSSVPPQAQVVIVWLLTAPQLVWCHFAMHQWTCYCFRPRSVLTVDLRIHCKAPEQIWIVSHIIVAFTSLTIALFHFTAMLLFCRKDATVKFDSMSSNTISCMKAFDESSPQSHWTVINL